MLIKLDNGYYINPKFVTSIDGVEGSYTGYLAGDGSFDHITSADRERIIKAMGVEGQGTSDDIDPDVVYYITSDDRVTKMFITSGKFAGLYDVTAEMLGAKEDEDDK